MVEDHVRAEGVTIAVFFGFFALLELPGVTQGTASALFAVVFGVVCVLVAVSGLRRGWLRLDDEQLLVRGWVRTLRVPRSELAGFSVRQVVRGAGHRRDQIWAQTVNGDEIRLESIHGPVGSARIANLADRLNQSVTRPV